MVYRPDELANAFASDLFYLSHSIPDRRGIRDDDADTSAHVLPFHPLSGTLGSILNNVTDIPPCEPSYGPLGVEPAKSFLSTDHTDMAFLRYAFACGLVNVPYH